MFQLLALVVDALGSVLGLVLAVTGPFRYVPYLIIPAVVAAALIGVSVYRLRRASKKGT